MAGGPTIYDIASRAGVGIATVSRVLNGSERVADATRAAVRRAMSELGFRPNRAARRLAAGSPLRPRVAALMPFFSANFYFSVTGSLSQGLAEADIDLVLYNVQSREDKNRVLDRLLAEGSCEGLVLCSMGIGAGRREQFTGARVPVAAIDYPLEGVPSVTVDNVAGGAMAARHLLGAGATRLALVSGDTAALAFRSREQGFLAEAGAKAPVARARAVTRDQGRVALAALLERDPGIDGVVCVNDQLAVGVLEELRARGRAVPDAVQVIGFDDQPLMDMLGLSTVHQPMAPFGAWAAAAMRQLLADPGGPPPPSTVLPLTVIPRQTSRRARARAAPARRPRVGR